MNETTTCPKCGRQFAFETESVFTDPERILDLSAFRTECPGCGASLMLSYPCIYQDTERGGIIRLIPRGFDLSDLPAAVSPYSTGFFLRDTYTVYSFREKVLIFEHSLDDRAVELLKIITIQQNPERFHVQDTDALLLADADDETLSFYALAKDGMKYYIFHPVPMRRAARFTASTAPAW